MKKSTCLLLLIILTASCQTNNNTPKVLNGAELIQKSIEVHDPNNNWQDLVLNIRTQEPRVGNPGRFSEVKLNNKTGAFEMIRNREQHLSKHIIDENGNATTLLDNSDSYPDSLIAKYRLQPERNQRYRNFYQTMYRLPMSLKIDTIFSAEEAMFNNTSCYKISLQLEEEVFSKYWDIFLEKDSYIYKGMEITFPDEPEKGERLYFNGEAIIDGVKIPRTRHWHELSDDAYMGSDILVKELE